MKYIVKLFLVLVVFFVSGCNLFELDEKLTDPNAVTAENVELNLLMNNIVLEFVEFVDEASDLTMPYVRMTAMTGGDRYDNQDSPQSFDFIWGKAYAELIPDINLAIEIADEGGFTVPAAMAKTIKAYIIMTLVDLFGDIPYSQAFQGTANPSPQADPGENVYDAALELLDAALTDLKNPVGSVAGDLYYGSDATKWRKLATTLKMRYYINTKLVNTGTGSTVASLIPDVMTEISEDFEFPYGSNRVNPDSRHPYYSDGYETGGPSWYLSNYYMWLFFGEKNTEDPRLRYYFYRQDCDENGEDFFTLECQEFPYPFHWPPGFPFCTASNDNYGDPNMEYGGYWGRDHGNDDGIPPDDLKRTAWGLYPAGGKFDADDCNPGESLGTAGGRGAGIQPIMLASWAHFMRAEAALTMNTGEDARQQLELGVRKSIEKVMGFRTVSMVPAQFEPTMDHIDDYVDEVLSLYDNAASTDDKMQVVMKEYFLALQGNGVEAYNGYRRTCKPAGMQPVREVEPGPFARSFWYPASYVNRNENASQKSNLTGPVFWDTNQAGCVD